MATDAAAVARAPRRTTPRRTTLRRRGAFALHASVLAVLLAASSVPTPLYALYQEEWHFSPLTLTIVFSAYALALLAALLGTGELSDHLGRRPVLAASLAAEAVSMAIFAGASSVGMLIAARVLQGLATGVATSAAGAALVDFEHRGRPGRAALANSILPVLGMAAGVLTSTALVQFALAPERTGYIVLFAVFAAQSAAITRTDETSGRPAQSRRLPRPRIAVAPAVRPALLATVPAVIVAWALGGFCSSLGPSLARLMAPGAPASVGGLAFLAFTLTAAITIAAARRLPARAVSAIGVSALVPAAIATLAAVYGLSLAALFCGTVLAGIGFGAVTQGTLRQLLAAALPGQRSGTLAAYYIVAYLAMSLPSVAAGLVATDWGLATATSLYCAVVLALVPAAFAAPILARRS